MGASSIYNLHRAGGAGAWSCTEIKYTGDIRGQATDVEILCLCSACSCAVFGGALDLYKLHWAGGAGAWGGIVQLHQVQKGHHWAGSEHKGSSGL